MWLNIGKRANGREVRSNSEATVFAHNLFVDCGYVYYPDLKRRSQYYRPHTTVVVGRKTGTAQDDKWFNNIFVRIGLDKVKEAPGYASDHNLFLEGAEKSGFGDENSLVEPSMTGLAIESMPRGARISFSLSNAHLRVEAKRIDAERFGVFPTVGQRLEDRDGRPIIVDPDVNGRRFSRPLPGPISDLKPGLNTITWPLPQHRG